MFVQYIVLAHISLSSSDYISTPKVKKKSVLATERYPFIALNSSFAKRNNIPSEIQQVGFGEGRVYADLCLYLVEVERQFYN